METKTNYERAKRLLGESEYKVLKIAKIKTDLGFYKHLTTLGFNVAVGGDSPMWRSPQENERIRRDGPAFRDSNVQRWHSDCGTKNKTHTAYLVIWSNNNATHLKLSNRKIIKDIPDNAIVLVNNRKVHHRLNPAEPPAPRFFARVAIGGE